ncbi:MAG: DUF115 domain-containing protein [Phycisphaerae bacterium]|nr:DUF115 domain-containing protein [Phycisphaerae bacterium]
MTIHEDPSVRFLADADSPLPANLAALWAVDARLAARVESAEPARCQLAMARSGVPTLLWSDGSGRTIPLHSRYDPEDEARRLVSTALPMSRSVDTSPTLLLFIHGFGLGYHVEQALAQAGEEAIAFVFEPRVEVLAAACAARDLRKLLSSGRVAIVTEPDKANLFAALMPHAALTSAGTAVIRHQPSLRIAPEEHAEFEQLTSDFLAYAGTCVGTLVANGRRTAENILRNLPWYLANPGISRLKGAFSGKPAIIVSAGPSLRKNQHQLLGARERAVIIAVQTTLQPLLELGVEPHFVTSLDYHDICTRFFERLPQVLRCELVAEPKATDAIFHLFPGPISLLGNDYADGLLSGMDLSRARLPAGATVAHLAFYLAEYLGCDPIIFVGQDLGFSDGLCYAPGTSYEDVWRPELGRFCTVEMKQWEQIVRDRPILRRVPDRHGLPTYTEARLFTYLQHFERDFARSRATIIDATEGGVLKRGAKTMTLREALETWCRSPLDRSVPPHPGLSGDLFPAAVQALRARWDEAGRIRAISERTLVLLREIADHLDDQPRVNRAIGQIDSLRVELEPLDRTYHLITQLTQQTEMQRFLADRRIAAANLDPTERQRRQVLRDLDNVSAVEAAARELQSLIKEAIERIESFPAASNRRAA